MENTLPINNLVEIRLPNELTGVPVMKVEDLLETDKVKFHNQGGQDSIGFTISFSQITDHKINRLSFLKIFTTNPDLKNNDIVSILESRNRDKNYTEQIIRNAIGIKKGHEILPDDVPNLQAMLTYKDELVGHSSEFVEGKSVPPDPNDHRIQTLQKHSISVDTTDGALNLVGDKFIDLNFEGILNY